jgi:FtsH-binding integral membrane protein
LALVVAVCLGAVAVWSWLDPRLTLARGGAAVAAVLLAGIGLDGHFYAEVPSSVPFLLLAVAPVVGLMAARRGLPPRHQALASSTAVLVMVALAVTIAVTHQLPEKVEEGP